MRPPSDGDTKNIVRYQSLYIFDILVILFRLVRGGSSVDLACTYLTFLESLKRLSKCQFCDNIGRVEMVPLVEIHIALCVSLFFQSRHQKIHLRLNDWLKTLQRGLGHGAGQQLPQFRMVHRVRSGENARRRLRSEILVENRLEKGPEHLFH